MGQNLTHERFWIEAFWGFGLECFGLFGFGGALGGTDCLRVRGRRSVEEAEADPAYWACEAMTDMAYLHLIPAGTAERF